VSANSHNTNAVCYNKSSIPLAWLQACPHYPQGKSQVHLITRHEGPEGKWRYSYTPSLTLVLDRGG